MKEVVQPQMLFPSHKCLYVPLSITQSFLLGFWWSSNNITASNKEKNTRAYQSM